MNQRRSKRGSFFDALNTPGAVVIALVLVLVVNGFLYYRLSTTPIGEEARPENVAATGESEGLASLVAVNKGQEEGQEAMVRVAYLSPDAANGDVYVNDEPVGALRDVAFGTVSPYLALPAGTRNVKVYPAGAAPKTSRPILETDMDLEGGGSYTLAAVGLAKDGSLELNLYEDDTSSHPEGKAKLRVIHALPDVGTATVRVKEGDGDEDSFARSGFSKASNYYTEIPAGTYHVEVEDAGTDEMALDVPDLPLPEGEVCTIFAVGRAADGSLGAVPAADGDGGGSLPFIPLAQDRDRARG